MKIWVLTFTDTRESFSPKSVRTFVSHELATKVMHEEIAKDLGRSYEDVSNPNGFEDGQVSVGYDYARDDSNMHIWEIFENEISLRDTIIGNLIAVMHEKYFIPNRFDNTLYRLINEYSDCQLFGIASESEFISQNVIGEAIYQNALAELGGKTDEKSYGIILDFLNGNTFIDDCCKNLQFQEYELDSIPLENFERGNIWLIGMLALCDGWETIIENVQKDIDDKKPFKDKVFIATEENFAEKYKDALCKNHRELCSRLNDEQYYQLMVYNFNYTYKFSDTSDLRDVVNNFYAECKYALFKIIRHYGIDVIMNEFNWCIEISKPNKDAYWDFEFIGNPYEVADCIETLKARYDNLF